MTASDYKFVRGANIDAQHPHGDLDRIILDGNVLPKRPAADRTLRGEDIAFLAEAAIERRFCWDSVKIPDQDYVDWRYDRHNPELNENVNAKNHTASMTFSMALDYYNIVFADSALRVSNAYEYDPLEQKVGTIYSGGSLLKDLNTLLASIPPLDMNSILPTLPRGGALKYDYVASLYGGLRKVNYFLCSSYHPAGGGYFHVPTVPAGIYNSETGRYPDNWTGRFGYEASTFRIDGKIKRDYWYRAFNGNVTSFEKLKAYRSYGNEDRAATERLYFLVHGQYYRTSDAPDFPIWDKSVLIRYPDSHGGYLPQSSSFVDDIATRFGVSLGYAPVPEEGREGYLALDLTLQPLVVFVIGSRTKV